MHYARVGLCAFGGLFLATPLQAADVFTVDVDYTEMGGAVDSFTVGSSNAEELFRVIDNRNIPAGVPANFQGDEVISALVNFRGVDMHLSFQDFASGPNGNVLMVSIPGLNGGEGGEFEFGRDRNSREDALDDFVNFLKTNEDGVASDLSRELARSSPNDPIAGNPSSLQSRSADSDFEQSFTQRVSQVWGCSTGASASQMLMLAKAGFGCMTDVADANFKLPAIEVAQLGGTGSDAATVGLYDDYFSRVRSQRGENKFNVGLDYAMVSATPGVGTELETSVLSLPLSYSFVFDADPRRKLIVRLPLALTKTEDASSYQIGLGLAYNHPVTAAWSLTPSFGYSAVGSEDLAAAAALMSFSLSSSYSFNFGGWALNIGNTIGQYSTQKLAVGDYESDPGISNTIFTNGLLISGPSSLLANDLVLEYFINDTRYTGDDLFTDNAQEFGINFGKLNTTNEVVTSFIKGGISYTVASGDNDNKADVLRLSLQFKF